MSDKGLFTRDQERAIARIIDDRIKLGAVGEVVDGLAAKILLRLVDDVMIEKLIERGKIKPDTVEHIRELADLILAERWQDAGAKGAEIINEHLDVPGLDEVSEGALLSSIIRLIISAILSKIEG